MIKITDVRISLMPNQEPLKAFASITLAECFVVHDLRIIKTQGRIFVAMPSRKVKDGNSMSVIHKDIAHPINKDMRKTIEDTVLSHYKSTVESMS